MPDVADEGPVRTHHQHTGSTQRRVCVQQPRCAVKANRGFAGSRAALNDERRDGVLLDRVVLLGRDRRDDLAHLPNALASDVLDDRFSEVILALPRQALVHKGMDAIVLDVETPPERDPPRITRGRGVERLCRRRPPIDRQKAIVSIDDSMPTDVRRAPVSPIDPAEIQRTACLRIDPDALSAHALKRVVGKLVDAAGRVPRSQLRQRLFERHDSPIEMLLLRGQLNIVPTHQLRL